MPTVTVEFVAFGKSLISIRLEGVLQETTLRQLHAHVKTADVLKRFEEEWGLSDFKGVEWYHQGAPSTPVDWEGPLSSFLPKPSAAADAPPTNTVTFILKPPHQHKGSEGDERGAGRKRRRSEYEGEYEEAKDLAIMHEQRALLPPTKVELSASFGDPLGKLVCVSLPQPLQSTTLGLNPTTAFSAVIRAIDGGSSLTLTTVERIFNQQAFYTFCGSNLPTWSTLATKRADKARTNAAAIFGKISQKHFRHAMERIPEIAVRSVGGGFQAELKSVTSTALRQGVQHVLMDITHALFSAKEEEDWFYESPPTGYVLLGSAPFACVVSVEMVARLFVCLASSAFIMTDEEHTKTIANLKLPDMGERRNLYPLNVTPCTVLGRRSVYTQVPHEEDGELWFYKVIRFDAFPTIDCYFANMYEVYTLYQSLSLPDTGVLVPAKLLFGEAKVAVRMPWVQRSAVLAALSAEPRERALTDIADAVVFLALHGILYTDLREENILLRTSGGALRGSLIDYDDCCVVEPLTSYGMFVKRFNETVPASARNLWNIVLPSIESVYKTHASGH